MVDQEKVREGVRLILEGIGEDINREGLIETPDRIARMYCELAGGMDQNAATHLEKRFHVDNADMVGYHILFDVRASHASVFWKSTCCIYSKRRGSRSEQDRKNSRGFCKKTAAPGTADGTDRRCVYGQSAPAGRYGYDRGRASLHDDAWDQKTGCTDSNDRDTRCV